MGNFLFLGRGKANFFVGGGLTSKLASQCPFQGIDKHAPTALWRAKDVAVIRNTIINNNVLKKCGHKRSFSQGG